MDAVKEHKVWLLSQALALAALIGCWFYNGSVSEEVRALPGRVEAQQKVVVDMSAEVATIHRLRLDMERMAGQKRALSDRVPPISENRSTLQVLWQILGGTSGVEVMNSPAWQQKVGQDGLVHATRDVTIRGGFLDLGRLIQRLEDLPFVVGCTSVELTRDRDRSGFLLLELSLDVPFQQQ